jgi:hypothetical protein
VVGVHALGCAHLSSGTGPLPTLGPAMASSSTNLAIRPTLTQAGSCGSSARRAGPRHGRPRWNTRCYRMVVFFVDNAASTL